VFSRPARCFIGAVALALAVATILACRSMVYREDSTIEEGRRRFSLDGPWQIAFDPNNTGMRENRQKGPPVDVQPIAVPAAWQTTDAGYGYEGVAWYYKQFDVPPNMLGGGLRLCFEHVNFRATVWLNGRQLGEHEGGYVPFDFEVGPIIRRGEKNNLVVRVVETPRLGYADGLNLYTVPHGKESWYVNFGGICGAVSLVSHANTWLREVFIVPDARAASISVRCRVAGAEEADPLIVSAVATSSDGGVEYGAASALFDRKNGEPFNLEIKLREALIWSPDHPVLYRVKVRLVHGGQDAAGVILDEVADNVGLRTFEIRDNDFYLNGRRILLKAVFNQPFYPSTLCTPPDADWCRRQVQQMKAAGFNAVINHAPLAPRSFLDEADRQGLLVFQQPATGWIYSPDGDALESRLATQVSGMVLRDRNHPSVVIWGIFNEGSVGQAGSLAPRLAKLIQQIDPTRPILDETGAARAHYYPAGSDQGVPYSDFHFHPITPVSDATARDWRRRYENAGKETLLVQSAYGYGGITNLDAAVPAYEKSHRFLHEDYHYFSELRYAVKKSLKEWPLQVKFHSLGDFTAALQQAQARALQEQNEMFVLNPNLDVLCVTQWQDCVMESTGGLVDVWGAPKPAWEIFKKLNRPERLIVRIARPTTFTGEEVRAEVSLLTEAGLAGPALLALEYRDPWGHQVTAPEVRVELAGGRVQSLGTFAVGTPSAEGRYTIRARLSLFGEVLDTCEAAAYAVSGEAAKISSPVTVYDPDGMLRAYLARQDAKTNNLADCEEVHPVIVASDLGGAPAGVVARFFAAVRDGAWGILLSPPHPDQSLHQSGMLAPGIERMGAARMGCYAYALPHPFFEGLPVDALLGREYRNVMPLESLTPAPGFQPEKDWASVVGMVTGYKGFVGHCLMIIPSGKGRIVLSTLRITENLATDPLAGRLLANMIRHAEKAGGRTEATRLALDAVEELETTYTKTLDDENPRKREFVLVGPWPLKPKDGHGSTFDLALPPETSLEPGATYAAWNGENTQWRKTTISRDGLLELPAEFRRRFITAYALALLKSPEPAAARMVISSRGCIKAWFNGQEAYLSRDPVARLEGCLPSEKQIAVRVKLREGANQLLLKFSWAGEPASVSVRFLQRGKEMRTLEYKAPRAPGAP